MLVRTRLPPPFPIRPERLPETGNRILNAFHYHLEKLKGLATRADRVGVVIPARNEQATIGHCLDGVLESFNRDPRLFSVLGLNGCTDDTEGEVQEWLEAHSDAVWFSTDPLQKPPPESKKLHLWCLESEPGKDHAVLKQEEVFHSLGWCPEFTFQLDADVRMKPGDLDELMEAARRHNLVAVCGRPEFISRRDHEVMHLYHFETVVRKRVNWKTTSGAYLLCRPRENIAAIRALMTGGSASVGINEDTSINTVWNAAGLATLTHRGVAFETEIPDKMEEQIRQIGRWRAAPLGREEITGPPSRLSELRSAIFAKKRMAAFYVQEFLESPRPSTLPRSYSFIQEMLQQEAAYGPQIEAATEAALTATSGWDTPRCPN